MFHSLWGPLKERSQRKREVEGHLPTRCCYHCQLVVEEPVAANSPSSIMAARWATPSLFHLSPPCWITCGIDCLDVIQLGDSSHALWEVPNLQATVHHVWEVSPKCDPEWPRERTGSVRKSCARLLLQLRILPTPPAIPEKMEKFLTAAKKVSVPSTSTFSSEVSFSELWRWKQPIGETNWAAVKTLVWTHFLYSSPIRSQKLFGNWLERRGVGGKEWRLASASQPPQFRHLSWLLVREPVLKISESHHCLQ